MSIQLRFLNFIFMLALVLCGVCACASYEGVPAETVQGDMQDVVEMAVDLSSKEYILQPGDVLAITVYGEAELSREYRVDPDGVIVMGLIGDVVAAGLSVPEVRADILAQLKNGYLVNPSVSVDIASLRPVYVMGEVGAPGSYAYSPNLSVLNVVALAGGFTYRANRKRVDVTREGEELTRVPVAADVKPGDVIVVGERFF